MTDFIKNLEGLSVQQDSVEISDEVDVIEFNEDDFDVTEVVKRELNVTQKAIIPIYNSIKLFSTSATTYYAIGAAQNTATSPLSFSFNVHPPRTYFLSGTARNLIVSAVADASAVVTLTLMINGSDTLLSKQVSTTGTDWAFDIDSVNEITIADENYLTMKIVRSGGTLRAVNFYFEIVK